MGKSSFRCFSGNLLKGVLMLLDQEYGKKDVLLLRWILVIVVGNILLFSYPPKGSISIQPFFISFYVLTNILCSLCPSGWFQNQKFIFSILLLDVLLTTLALSIAVHSDSQFFLVFFLILLVAAASRRARLIYSAFGLILVVYGISLYIKSPEKFWHTDTLLRFPFIFVVTFFFHGMVESYNRLFKEKEILKEDYRELEVLTEVAQSIGQDRNLPKFLLTLTRTLTSKLELERCTAVYIDRKEEIGYMISSDDEPEKDILTIDFKRYPGLKDSVKMENPPGESENLSTLGAPLSRHILKTLPMVFRNKDLGTLYIRANTPERQLTHREEFFLSRLAHITAMAIYNMELDRMAKPKS